MTPLPIRFPDLPEGIAGLPAVLRLSVDAKKAVRRRRQDVTVDTKAQDATNNKRHDAPPRVTWGIYTKAGKLALEPDSIAIVEVMREERISTFPIEKGGFESFNKVAVPADLRVTVTKGGDDGARREFLRTLEVLLATLDVFDVVTPDYAYRGYSFVRQSFRRSAESGAALLIIELMMEEVRQRATAKFTRTKVPSAQDKVGVGPVQTVPPKPQQLPKRTPQ